MSTVIPGRDAYKELLCCLREGEAVEGIVFGDWGSEDLASERQEYECEVFGTTGPSVPWDKRGVLLTLEQAEPYMHGWQFSGGFGGADCFAMYAWTNQRVIWVHDYDGRTDMASAPRNPGECHPYLNGTRQRIEPTLAKCPTRGGGGRVAGKDGAWLTPCKFCRGGGRIPLEEAESNPPSDESRGGVK